MRIGRRTLFFAALCVICLVMVPVTPAEFRWLNLAMAGLAAFWSLAFVIEDVSTARHGGRHTHPEEIATKEEG
jgi:hypothetical protein